MHKLSNSQLLHLPNFLPSRLHTRSLFTLPTLFILLPTSQTFFTLPTSYIPFLFNLQKKTLFKEGFFAILRLVTKPIEKLKIFINKYDRLSTKKKGNYKVYRRLESNGFSSITGKIFVSNGKKDKCRI